MPEIQIHLSVLITRDQHADCWVARCLEYDVVAHGPNLAEVRDAFEKAFVGQLRANAHFGIDPWDIPPAPQHMFEKWRTATGRMEASPVRVPDTVRQVRSMPPALCPDLRIYA